MAFPQGCGDDKEWRVKMTLSNNDLCPCPVNNKRLALSATHPVSEVARHYSIQQLG
jgi:hypothetical protein